MTNSPVGHMLDTGRVTMRRTILVFAFVLRGQKLEDRMQMMGAERAADVLVDVPSGAHFKYPHT